LVRRYIAWRNRHAQDRMLREGVERANVALTRHELRAGFEELTASERIAQTAALSRTLTGIAGAER
jgi:hypothetical protein